MREVSVLLVGIGGFGENYVRILLENNTLGVKITGAVDPYPERCSRLEKLKEAGVPIFPSLDEFYSVHNADLAVISTPIHLHVEQSVFCMSKGSNVLCEKPLCAVYQEAKKMLEAEKKYGKFAAIAYQLSFSDAVQELKRDIMSGVFGKARRLKAIQIFPRHEYYYRRNSWAGKRKTSDGRWVLDSPVMNSCAHQLHNMLYVMGKTRETGANPVSVQAELYRANPLVQNFDTAALRCMIEDGVEVLMYTTQAIDAPTNFRVGPFWEFTFENATVYHEESYDEDFYVRFHDGRIKEYGKQSGPSPFKKLEDVVNAVRTGEKAACQTLAAMPHVLCINGAQESMEPADFPEAMIETKIVNGETLTYARDIKDILLNCYEKGKLPYELGYSFAKESRVIDLSNYSEYRGFIFG